VRLRPRVGAKPELSGPLCGGRPRVDTDSEAGLWGGLLPVVHRQELARDLRPLQPRADLGLGACRPGGGGNTSASGCAPPRTLEATVGEHGPWPWRQDHGWPACRSGQEGHPAGHSGTHGLGPAAGLPAPQSRARCVESPVGTLPSAPVASPPGVCARRDLCVLCRGLGKPSPSQKILKFFI